MRSKKKKKIILRFITSFVLSFLPSHLRQEHRPNLHLTSTMSARTILVPVDDSDVRFVGLGEGEGRDDAAFLASSFTATSPLFSSSFDLSLDLFDSTRLSSFFLTTTTGPFSPSLRFSLPSQLLTPPKHRDRPRPSSGRSSSWRAQVRKRG